jgi:hypothetical protein
MDSDISSVSDLHYILEDSRGSDSLDVSIFVCLHRWEDRQEHKVGVDKSFFPQ